MQSWCNLGRTEQEASLGFTAKKLGGPREPAMSTVCSQCGCSDIEYDQARGDAVCTACGCVLEDNIIVSEVTFSEQSSGASSVIGQFVSSESSKIPLSGSGFHHGMGKVSRDITIGQAKKRLSNLGHLLKLNQHCIDSALMFFKMALQMNLTRGRKSSIIDTACLYLVCRSEGTPHLLLDFSDVLQINVYSLGRAYLRLSNALHINPPAIDPCLYIHRFAHKLELGEKTHDVSMTALRLVARMKRDWIHHGRRPAGLCGAALLVSARLHNFNRSVKEVARVVKVSEGTLRKRLGDFKDTASSRLTIEEFLKIDLEQEHDPPSYLDAKKKAKQKVTGEGNEKEGRKGVGSGDEGDSEEEEEEEEETIGGFGGIRNQSVEEIIAKARFTESFLAASVSIGLTNSLDELAKLGEEEDKEESDDVENGDNGMLYTEDLDDKEIESLLLSEEEVKIKTKLWFAENGDFIKERELKREKLAKEKAEKEKLKKTRRPRKSRGGQSQHQQHFNNAGEAIGKMLVERRISTKINYDVLRDIEIDSAGGGGGLQESSISSSPSANHLAGSTGHVTASSSMSSQDSALTITRTPVRNRLPSLSSRKRNLSALNLTDSSHLAHPLSLSHDASRTPATAAELAAKRAKVSPSPVVETMEDVINSKIQQSANNRMGVGVARDDVGVADEVVEESGPVEYCDEGEEEGEGLGDEDIEDLAYDDDPLLANSDYEDYDEY